MKIASYNIFKGAQNSLPQLEAFVRQQNLDILCLQEANGWLDGTPRQLGRFAAATGLVHAAAGGNRAYKIATLSRMPFVATRFHSEGFWHGALQTIIHTSAGPIDMWNAHLKPRDEDGRLPEAKYIANRIDTDALGLLLGDMNSLAEVDDYPADLARILAAKGITKFGTDHTRYDVIQTLQDSDLYDIAAERGANVNTVPTPVNTDKYHADDLRLDYMFGTRSLMEYVTECCIVKDELTDRISDHYPQVLTVRAELQ